MTREPAPFAPEGLTPKTDVDAAHFAALDLRVGRVVTVAPFPEARTPAWKLEVDLGVVLGRRWTSAQVTNYRRDELEGRLVVAAVNLGAKRIAGFRSELLVLGALEPDGTVRLLEVPPGVPLGAPIA